MTPQAVRVVVLAPPGAAASSVAGLADTFALAADLDRDPRVSQAERAAGRSPAERGGTAPPARDPRVSQAERAAGRSPAERGGTAPPARDPRRWSVRVAGTDGAPIPGAGGLTLQPQVGLRALASADLILLPGMGRPRPALFAVGEALAPHLTRAQTRGALLASACTGAFVLAEAGLLDGRAATTHWRYAEELQRRHPQVDLHPERMVVEDHGVCTSGGANACFDLALYLVARIAGPALARATADALVMDTREDQRPYMHARRATGVEDVRLQRALAFMHAQYARAFTLDEAARAAGTSVRTFKRLFRDALDTTPKAYVQGLRVEAAKHLLARGGRSVEEVATAVGYTDPASFRLVFRRHVGCAPRDFRRRGR